jgi:hypothetical protein
MVKNFGTFRWVAVVRDANISGELYIPLHTIAEAEQLIRDAGTWRTYRDASLERYPNMGAVLLSEPEVRLFSVARDSTALLTYASYRRDLADGFYCPADALLETGPRWGVRRVF